MNLFWKGAAALSLAVTGLGAMAVPAQAQYYGSGWHGDRHDRWDRRDHRRWDDRRHWRGDRRDWRGPRGHYRQAYRTRCWNEWRYDRYRDRDVRVRICR